MLPAADDYTVRSFEPSCPLIADTVSNEVRDRDAGGTRLSLEARIEIGQVRETT